MKVSEFDRFNRLKDMKDQLKNEELEWLFKSNDITLKEIEDYLHLLGFQITPINPTQCNKK